ncbi:ankyrin repeat-containing domain protein [Aspergillus transmontanensis]|uniref:Ankyrin repeat-containing domain protein n=1 Tax=Aspergillus transmontanensis TaxID=1034304 RepID=A0A5N6VW97_9EURO|nr:ankyrin repeat-containing domain protein [Aspergillus transmontanensis]
MQNESPLSVAVFNRNMRIATLLLDAGTDPSHPLAIEANRTILHQYIKWNNVLLLKELLRYALPIDQMDERGRTPLNCLGPQTNPAIIRLLVFRGANVNFCDNRSRTPSTKAIHFNNLEIAKFLVSRGARADAPIGPWGTPLHLACIKSPLNMVRMLVETKVNLDYIEKESIGTVFQAACLRVDRDNTGILIYLLKTAKIRV